MILKTANPQEQGFSGRSSGKHVNMEKFLFPCLEFHVSSENRISLNRQFFLKSLFFNIKA